MCLIHTTRGTHNDLFSFAERLFSLLPRTYAAPEWRMDFNIIWQSIPSWDLFINYPPSPVSRYWNVQLKCAQARERLLRIHISLAVSILRSTTTQLMNNYLLYLGTWTSVQQLHIPFIHSQIINSPPQCSHGGVRGAEQSRAASRLGLLKIYVYSQRQ